MKAAVLAAIAAGALASAGCTTQTECDYINKTPVGDVNQDVIGCWQGFGPDSLVVYQFFEDNTFHYVEPPNRFAGSGLRLSGAWKFEAATATKPATFWVADAPNDAVVNETTLQLTDLEFGSREYLRRAVCRGFGFEEGQTCPQ